MAGVKFLLLFGLIVGSEADICADVRQSEEAVQILKSLNDGGTSMELSEIKNLTLPSLRAQIIAQASPYFAYARNDRLANDHESKSCLLRLPPTEFLRAINHTVPVLATQTYERSKYEYFDESVKLTQLEHRRQRFIAHESPYTYESLRFECERANPGRVRFWLHDQMVTVPFLSGVLNVTFASGLQDTKAWTAWTRMILNDYHRAAILSQICLGLRSNADDAEEYIRRKADEANKGCGELFDKLIEMDRVIRKVK